VIFFTGLMPRPISSNTSRILPLVFSGTSIATYLFLIWIDQTLIFPDGQRHIVLFDDAMISMRFGLNLVQGKGLVWNAGEYVEGYTNPLWVLIMALLIFLFGKLPAVWAVSLLGICIAATNCFLTGKICQRVWSMDTGPISNELKRRHTWVSVLMVGLYFPLAFLSIAGMETGLQAMLFLLFFYLFIGNELILLQSLLIALLYLTRPDSVLLVAVVVLMATGRLWSSSKCSFVAMEFFISQLRRLWIAPVLLFGAHMSFRYCYYGELVPNTYVLKVQHIPVLYRMANGVLYTLYTFFDLWLIVLCVAASCVASQINCSKLTDDVPSHSDQLQSSSAVDNFCSLVPCDMTGSGRLSWYALGLLVAVAGYQIYVGGDVWLLHRFLAPVVPLGGIVASYELLNYFNKLGARASAALTVGLLFLSMNFSFLWDRPVGHLGRLGNTATLRSEHFRVYWEALQLKKLVVKDTATMAVMWAGLIPYYTDFRAIDCLGKVDPEVARLSPREMSWSLNDQGLLYFPGHNKYDLSKCIKYYKPDYVQMSRWGRDDLSDWVATHYVTVQHDGVELLVLPSAIAPSSSE
jgi:hypothetical protein